MISFRKVAIKSCDKRSSHHRYQNQIQEVGLPLNSKSKSQNVHLHYLRFDCDITH